VRRVDGGNLFDAVPRELAEEEFRTLLAARRLTLVRIVSTGQSTPPSQWYDQDDGEWVVLLRGGAGLRFADEAQVRELRPGDFVHIPAHRRHRLEWTAEDQPTVWLALHYQD
jgi:cupin 2 domain-containing protein